MITKFEDDINFFFRFRVITSSQVAKFIQYMACFLGSLVVAFIKGWLLTLVLLSTLPLLILSGSIMSFTFAKMASRGQAAYSEAATIVERKISSIRTVRMSISLSKEPFMFQTKDTQHDYSNGCRLHHLPARSKLYLNTINP